MSSVAQMQRQRIFLYARKPGVKIFAAAPGLMNSERMKAEALRPWNSAAKPPLQNWLQRFHDAAEIERLQALGNIVIPACARLACHMFGNMER